MYRVVLTHLVTETGSLVRLSRAECSEAEAPDGPKAIEAADFLMAGCAAAHPGCGSCATVHSPRGVRFDLCSSERPHPQFGLGVSPEPAPPLYWRAMLSADANARALLSRKARRA